MSNYTEIKSSGSRGLSSERIVKRILDLSKEPKLQSQLLNQTLISRSTLSRYISHLMREGLLEQVKVDGKTKLQTTKRGNEYLGQAKESDKVKEKERRQTNDGKSAQLWV